MRLSFLLVLLVSSTVRAQDTSSATIPVVPEPKDTVLRRAEQMVSEGHGPAGRALIDSVLAATAPGTPQYAEVLFAKASEAATAAEAERDLQRVIVEYPSSPRADDALLRLAQEEIVRGDKEDARQHLTRLDRDRPPTSTWPRANLSVARAWIEVNDLPRACAALTAAHQATPSSYVELIHQLDYTSQPCASLLVVAAAPPPKPSAPPAAATASVPAPTVTAPATSTPAPVTSVPAPTTLTPSMPAPVTQSVPVPTPSASTPSVSTPVPAPVTSVPAPTRPPVSSAPVPTPRSGGGNYTVQVAAYDTRGAAEALASKLRDRGYDVRVWGAAAPFRVRIGHYPTRSAAERQLTALQAKSMSGFVTAAEP